MNLQAVIAAACDLARNKHASAHVNAAQARLIAALIENPPPAFSLYPMADEFESAQLWLLGIVGAMDDLMHQVVVDAAGNSTIPFTTKDRQSMFRDALNDSGVISDLSESAERYREDALQAAE